MDRETPQRRPRSGYNERVSPGRYKISQLSEKQNNLDTLEDNKNSKRHAFENRQKELDDRIRKSHQNDEATFKLFKEQILKLQEALSSQKVARELLDDKKAAELKMLDTNINLDINVERQERKEAESEINKMFEDKMGRQRLEMNQENKNREIVESNTTSTLTDQISIIQGELFAERKNREETYDKIIKKLGNDVLRVNDVLNNEKKTREESHSGLLKMLEEMHSGLHYQINTEKRQRDETQDFLLRLLEETTARVESHLINS